jgi:hypothetical protein
MKEASKRREIISLEASYFVFLEPDVHNNSQKVRG